jgi:AcrR family transcriptional regulator
MTLHDEHKAERRARILSAARRLIARRGVACLNMRDLADEARVSVPTVYNLIGGKQELLVTLLQSLIEGVASAQVSLDPKASFVDRANAMCLATQNALLEMPGYARELVLALLTADDQGVRNTIAEPSGARRGSCPEALPRGLRESIDRQSIELTANLLRLGQAEGELVEWADPELVAGAMYMALVAAMIRWAKRELDDEGLCRWISAGTGLALLGVTRGRARTQMEELLKSIPPLSKDEKEQKHGRKIG